MIMDFKAVHDKLTQAYYVDKALDKETFQKLHTACWLYFEQQEMAAGRVDDKDLSDTETPYLRSEFVSDKIVEIAVSEEDLKAWE